MQTPYYDPKKTYEENFKEGPFGAFADGEIFKQEGEPKYNFLGQEVFSPFGIPSGPLVNGKFVKAALDKGFDIAEYKDTRTKKYPCNPMPNIVPLDIKDNLTLDIAERGVKQADSFYEPLSITNSFGIPSFDPDFWQPDLRDAALYAKKGQVVVGGLQGTLPEKGGFNAYLEDFMLIARLVKETGVKIIELNLSCPNEGVNNLLCFDIERSQKVVEAVKNELGNTPLIVKISYFPENGRLEKFVTAVAPIIQAIAAVNTIPSKIVDAQGNPVLTGGRVTSGVCGASIKWAGLDMTKKLVLLKEKLNLNFSIIGVGGVINVKDYSEYFDAGADTVMSATGSMWNSYLAQEIKKVLE